MNMFVTLNKFYFQKQNFQIGTFLDILYFFNYSRKEPDPKFWIISIFKYPILYMFCGQTPENMLK